MTKYYVQVTGILDAEGLPREDAKEDLRIKAQNLKLENLQVYFWGKVRESKGSEP